MSRAAGITQLADEGSDGHHLQDGFQAVQRQACGTEDGVGPQHEGLPEQEVDTQQGTGHREDQAGGQRHLGLCQVALGAQVQASCFQNPQQEQQSQVEDQVTWRITENLTCRQWAEDQSSGYVAGQLYQAFPPPTYFCT